LLPDALGSPVVEADDSGAILTAYSYEPFGVVTSSGAMSTNPNRDTGRPDDQTGLFYHRARYYDPRLARFGSEDPAGPHDGLNLYAYVGNSPINFVDTNGLYRTTKDFPPELRADVDAAMALLKQKLTDTCCAGKKTPGLLKKASDPTC
jgi:RHS repeat-associated protein